jgi:hypothetical protein
MELTTCVGEAVNMLMFLVASLEVFPPEIKPFLEKKKIPEVKGMTIEQLKNTPEDEVTHWRPT